MDQEEKIQKQYNRLIIARNFHYENLNKWLITFYAIIGALFLALHTLHASEYMHRHMELCVAIAGYIVSVGAILSIKGYAYWEINWIMLIHDFEDRYVPINNRVYGVFANMDANKSIWHPTMGANVSTTKVALAITSIVAVLWGTMVLYFGINLLNWGPDASRFEKIAPSLVVSVIATFGFVALLASLLRSDLSPLKDRELNQKEENYMDKLNKRIAWIIGISVAVIIAIVSLCAYYNVFEADTAFYVKVGISLLALATAGLGVYLTYTIQTTIIKTKAKNRERDEFTQRLQIYIDNLDKVNIDVLSFQDAVNKGKRPTNVTIACANVLCSQAYLAYYAFQDLVSCKFYRATFATINNADLYHKDIPSQLSKISDLAYVCMTDISKANLLIGLVNDLNNDSADFHREIYQILYPNQESLEERTV